MDKNSVFEYEVKNLEVVNLKVENKLKLLETEIIDFKKKLETDNKYITEAELISFDNKKEKFNDIVETVNKPYFARMDFKFEGENVPEIIYLGKTGIEFEDEKYNITDWRTPLGNIYYKGSLGDCYDVFTDSKGNIRTITGEKLLKRRFEIEDKKLIKIQDLETVAETREKEIELADNYLIEILKDSSSSRLKDIIATIQETQNNIIREELNKVVCIQGCAGSGKSTIALHRIAFLLYYYNEKLTAEDILIIAPNKLFIEYISNLLPDLGVINIKQDTYSSFVKYILNENIEYNKLKDITFTDNKNYFNKGDLKFKDILDNYVDYMINEIIPKADLSIYGTVLLSKEDIKKIFINDFSIYKLNDRLIKFKEYLQKLYKDKVKEYILGKEKEYDNAIEYIKIELKNNPKLKQELISIIEEKERIIKRIKNYTNIIFTQYVKDLKPMNVVKKYKELITNKPVLAFNALQILSSNEINNIIESSKYGLNEDDLAGILYLYSKLNNLDNSFYKHIVIDESQDLSPFEIYTLRNFVYNNSFTIVGDINQRIIPSKLTYEERLMKNIFDNSINFKEYILNRSYRSSYEIMMFANEILKFNSVNKQYLPDPIQRHGEKPLIIGKHFDSEIIEEIVTLVKNCDSNYKNIAIILRNEESCIKYYNLLKDKIAVDFITEEKNYIGGVCIFPAYLTKGLEFDMVILGDCNNENYKNNKLETNLLYVLSTRAMHNLVIMYSEAMSPLLLKIGKAFYQESETDQEKLFKIKIAKESLIMLLNAKFGSIDDSIEEIIKEELDFDKIQELIKMAAIENDINKIFNINNILNQEEKKITIKSNAALVEEYSQNDACLDSILENFMD